MQTLITVATEYLLPNSGAAMRRGRAALKGMQV